MHYHVQKNYPVAWQGLFTNKDEDKSIVLEAVAYHSLWIEHAYFGLLGGNNDLNVLQRSLLVNNLLRSDANDVQFTVNGSQYSRYYLLTDFLTDHGPHHKHRHRFCRLSFIGGLSRDWRGRSNIAAFMARPAIC